MRTPAKREALRRPKVEIPAGAGIPGKHRHEATVIVGPAGGDIPGKERHEATVHVDPAGGLIPGK